MLPVDLATFTEKMFNEKFHFLCSGCSRGNELKNVQAYQVFAVCHGIGMMSQSNVFNYTR